jgi:phosphoglycerate dehydrogenase-like enzyme
LRELADLTFNERDENWPSERLAAEIAPFDALVTCWGSPVVTDAVLDAAPNLKIVSHAAGSVKGCIPENVLKRGVLVSSAAIAMSPAVAEFSLILCFLGLRAIHLHDRAMREDHAWPEKDAFGIGSELASQRVGVVGCGMIGRIFIGMVRGFGVTPKVYDPYLNDDDAAALGVVKAELTDLMASSDLIVNHAPTTPETHHMIGAAELAAMPDGALLVNTARSWVIDQDALLAELRSGRIRAALDVYDREPLPADHPFRDLPNVILTPHIAGWTRETRYRQGASVLRNLTDAFAGRPLPHAVTLDRYHLLA